MPKLFKLISYIALLGWMIIFAAILLCPSPTSGREPESRENKVITGEKFLDDLAKTSRNGNKYTLVEHRVKGQIPRISSARLGGAEISNVIFERDLYIEDTIFSEALSFRNCTFMGAVRVSSESKFAKGITFQNCVFEDEVSFSQCFFGKEQEDEQGNVGGISSFENCIFDRELKFLRSEFYTIVDFTNCLFSGDVLFGYYPYNERQAFKEGKQDDEGKKTIFKGEVIFTKSIFKGKAFFPYAELFNVNFGETIFEGPARFSKAKFNGSSDFSRAIFKSTADFERAIFYPRQSTENQGKQSSCSANFYKVSFANDVSFSKAIFLIDADFKRVNFGQRAFFANTFFAKEANFEMCFFDRELFGAKINDLEPIVAEVTLYKLNESWNNLMKAWIKRHESSKELIGRQEGWYDKEVIWRQIKQKGDPTPQVVGATKAYLDSKFGRFNWRTNKMALLHGDKDLSELLGAHRGKEAYIGPGSFAIIDAFDLPSDQNKFIFTGAHFGGEVDLRGALFNEADFSSGETVTVFYGPADLSNALFNKISLEGTVFLSKLSLPLENLFPESKMISRSFTFFDLPKLLYAEDLRKRGDTLVGNPKSLRKLYNQLEPLFRKNFQLPEANEMAVRASWLNFRDGEDLLTSFFTFIALPIKNLILIMLAVNLFFCLCLIYKGSIYGRIPESFFKPGKLPLVLIRSAELREQKRDNIVRVERWQKLSWPLFLCFGTFFAFFSLGSKYVTSDESCLKKMKILRLAGFIFLPLFIYSLAKRSEGLHKIFTLI